MAITHTDGTKVRVNGVNTTKDIIGAIGIIVQDHNIGSENYDAGWKAIVIVSEGEDRGRKLWFTTAQLDIVEGE